MVAAEGKSHRSNAHATPTFFVLWRSTDRGSSFGPAVPLLNESGGTVYGGGTLVYSDKSKTLRLLFTIDTSSNCHPACGAGNLSILASGAAGAAGSWAAAGPAAGADGERFPSSGQVNSGIQLKHGPHRGRLVVPRELFLGPKPAAWPTTGGFENHAGVIFSDNEQAWSAGALLPPPFREEESAIAELTVRAAATLVAVPQSQQNGSLVPQSKMLLPTERQPRNHGQKRPESLRLVAVLGRLGRGLPSVRSQRYRRTDLGSDVARAVPRATSGSVRGGNDLDRSAWARHRAALIRGADEHNDRRSDQLHRAHQPGR